MAETLTSRFGLVQWGVGTDSPSRIDFNGAFLNLETRAAYDDGETYASLPVTNVVQGRYVSVLADGRRTLYRRSEEGTWDFAGGSTVPETLTLRPPVSGAPATDANALVLSHPGLASAPGAQWAWDGSLTVGGTMRVFDGNDPVKGTVIIGASLALAADPAVNGRLHVRTRANAERGLVLRAHASTAGSLLAIQESSGSDTLTVDADGRLQQRTVAAFGGAAVPTASSMAVAPTSSPSDSITNGLLLHGHAAPADTKTILRVLRQADETAEIASVGRDAIMLGRLPWGSASSGGTVSASGRQLLLRASGYDSDGTLWRLTRADISNPANGSLDEPVLSLARTTGLLRVPTVLTQALGTSGVNLTLKRYTDLTQRFLELQRMGAGESSEVVGAWDSEGRLLAGTRWIATGTTRDARQPIHHVSTKRYATPGVDGFTVGQAISPTNTYTYTFGSFQLRSASIVDLNIELQTEYTMAFETDDFGNSSLYRVYVSINGGAFSLIETREFWGHALTSVNRPIGVTGDLIATLGLVPVGATVQVRVQVQNNSSGSGPAMYLRLLYVNVEESLVLAYSAP